ncbi:MAG: AMP-binding protein [Clostridia bacterium]|nr:AMP-binding protein [Clostridia bacterium]
MENSNLIKKLVVDNFRIYDQKIAMLESIDGTNEFKKITYSSLRSDILALGTAMYKNEKIRNEKIAVIGENSVKWLITYMAVMCGVGIIVPLDKQLPANEIINLVKRANLKMIVFSNKKKELINEIKDSLPKDIQYVQMDKDDSKDISLDDMIAEGKDIINRGNYEFIQKKINPESFSALIFTSGTSSKSKGVMLSNKNIMSDLNSIYMIYKDVMGRRFLSFLPMHHTYEFTITYLAMLGSGGSIGISRGLRHLMEDFKIIKPEGMCCVPLLLENIKKKIQKTVKKEGKEGTIKNVVLATSLLGPAKLETRRKIFSKIHENFGGNLRYILCGAAAMEKETAQYLEGLGFILLQGYGLTEASPLVSGTTAKNKAYGTVGKAIPNVEVRIDITDKEENTGEIIVKGDNVMLGYYEDEEETKKVLKKGWLYTGDLGKYDEKGNLVITGRSKNVIVTSNGKNIYPEEIEAFIDKIPLVSESMVYGYEDEKKNIIVTARVTLNEEYISEKYKDSRPSDDEIYDMIWEHIKEINHKLVTYKSVKKLEIKKGEFVKTTTLKIKRNEELKNKI